MRTGDGPLRTLYLIVRDARVCPNVCPSSKTSVVQFSPYCVNRAPLFIIRVGPRSKFSRVGQVPMDEKFFELHAL